jgi:hypothetical protein
MMSTTASFTDYGLDAKFDTNIRGARGSYSVDDINKDTAHLARSIGKDGVSLGSLTDETSRGKTRDDVSRATQLARTFKPEHGDALDAYFSGAPQAPGLSLHSVWVREPFFGGGSSTHPVYQRPEIVHEE